MMDYGLDEYWELLEEQHSHDVIMSLSRVDAEEKTANNS